MSGHSKWSKVKHQKESTDAVKGKVFTKMANAIIIAIKTGGGEDPMSNFKLRLAIDRAKSANTPKENIERAIERARKSAGGEDMSEIVYEAIAPGGVGLMIKAATDNKQRTVSEIKNIIDKAGGVLAGSGAVSYNFKYTGEILINTGEGDAEKILERAVEAGAEDYEEDTEGLSLYTGHGDLHKVKEALEKQGININSAQLVFKPINTVKISTEVIVKLNHLIEKLEEREDVLAVFSNMEA